MMPHPISPEWACGQLLPFCPSKTTFQCPDSLSGVGGPGCEDLRGV